MKSDEELFRDVYEGLEWGTLVPPDRVKATVNNGVVILEGAVSSYTEKFTVELAVTHVEGVKAVRNEIRVAPAHEIGCTKGEIEPTVLNLLAQHLWTSGSMTVNVDHGWVTLRGDGSPQYKADAPWKALNHLPFLAGDGNPLKAGAKRPPSEKAEKIGEVLKAGEAIDGCVVTVSEDGTRVTLAGTARTWAARYQAARIAWSAPGVQEVENTIRVASRD